MEGAKRLHEAIGHRLRELRRAKQPHLSQERLGAEAGMHFTYVSRLERGETAATVDSLAALCRALGVTLSEFFEPFHRQFEIRGPRRKRS